MTHPLRVDVLAPAERSDRQQQLMELAGREFGVFSTLVRNPDLFADFLVFAGRLLRRSGLPPRDREILILRTARRCGAAYEWAHHAVIGRKAGLSDADIADIAAVDGNGARDAEGTSTLLRAVDQLVTSHRLDDATWAELTDQYDEQQVIEICLLVGNYAMIAGALNSLGVQIEDGYVAPDWARS